MKFFHLSDLHIGKHLHHYNLKEDQEAILRQVVEYVKKERPDGIIIAGDIYDKSSPAAEAVAIFDEFLTALSKLTPTVWVIMISGNHDSAQRLNYASGILKKHSLYIAGMPPLQPTDNIQKIIQKDAFGTVNFYLLPFVKPGYVRKVFPDEVIESYDEAVKRLIERENIDARERNVLVSHQFFTAGGDRPVGCDSETIMVGGLDQVDIQAVEGFDYVALGHMHGAQQMGKPWIRYCGTPLKYSVSESNHMKSITVVTLGAKEKEPVITTLPLSPLYDIRKISGTLSEICAQWENSKCQDYVSITLTDETELYKPKDELDACFERILEVKVDNARTRAVLENLEDIKLVTDPLSAFQEFFQELQNRCLKADEMEMLKRVILAAKEGEEG